MSELGLKVEQREDLALLLFNGFVCGVLFPPSRELPATTWESAKLFFAGLHREDEIEELKEQLDAAQTCKDDELAAAREQAREQILDALGEAEGEPTKVMEIIRGLDLSD